MGEARIPKVFGAGDEVTVEIDGVGLLTNPVVEEMDGEEEKGKQFMKVAILQFPGSNCDWDSEHAVNDVLGIPAKRIWHKDKLPSEAEAVIVPGGFSFGDYLRCGAIARFSPIMKDLLEFADMGGQVLGICNGFQILCESGLLPGALVRNDCIDFRCINQPLLVENSNQIFNPANLGESLTLPIAHGEGNYRTDESTLASLEENGQVLFRYSETQMVRLTI